MKRYLCFTGAYYYADGGWSDFRGAYETIEAAVAANPTGEIDFDWRQVVDVETLQIVEGDGLPAEAV